LKTALVFAIPAAFAFASPKVAEAQIVVGAVIQGPEVVVEPPSAFIATAAPEYYSGRPCYWWHDHWYYRDGYGRWGYYRAEPEFLAGRRALWVRPGYYGRPGYVGGYGYRREGWHEGHEHGEGWHEGHEHGEGHERGGYRPAPARWGYRR
jgi:hypothetical protein